jgi:outer membrane protein assembly factor BamB
MILCVLLGRPLGAQSSFGLIRLAPDSPLATDGRFIFAVADDGRTPLVRPTSGVVWEVLKVEEPFQKIRGLAYGDGVLYVGDSERRAVVAIDLGTRQSVRLPIERWIPSPGSMAFAGDLFVAAGEGETVVQWDPRTREGSLLDADLGGRGPLLLAASRNELILVSMDSGRVIQFAGVADARRRVEAQREPSIEQRQQAPFQPSIAKPAAIVARENYPRIENPVAVALYAGNVYAIDGKDFAIRVAYRSKDPLPRIESDSGVKRPTGLLVTEETMFLLDGDRGVLDGEPRFVPTEFDLGFERPSEALSVLYRQLEETRVLPKKRIPWKGTLEETLIGQGVTLGRPDSHFRDFSCWLNREACATGEIRLNAGDPFVVPDLPSQSIVDVETVKADQLDPQSTLGEEVDRRIQSPQFSSFRSEERLQQLNLSNLKALMAAGVRSLRDTRVSRLPKETPLTLPVERVRYLAALPLPLLREGYGLQKLRGAFSGFNWVLLEDQPAKAYGGSRTGATIQDPFDPAVVTGPHATLLKTINYQRPATSAATSTTQVGVAELLIDMNHQDFGPPTDVFIALTGHTPAIPAASTPPDVGPHIKAMLGAEDHGTAVAWLIGSREADRQGLAPGAFLVPMPRDDPGVGDAVRDAFLSGVKIFNLSLHFGDRLPVRLRQSINHFEQALFVVAAGNDATSGQPICESVTPYPAYPVCEGYRRNVLVVAATELDGRSLLTEANGEPGSNWNETLVHIAAPGEGFYAGGVGRSYVPVRGTSFATPLVTATAALLFEQGMVDPWAIKQRIIATAKVENNLRGKVMGAGLLDVGRAVLFPTKAALVDNTSHTTYVDLVPGQRMEIEWDGGTRTLPVDQVRRLTRMSGGEFRIVYLDDVTDTLVIQEGIHAGSWPFRYRALDSNGVVTGGPRNGNLDGFKDYVGPIR